MLKAIVADLRGSNKPRKDVVTRLVVGGEVYTDGDEVQGASTRVVNTGRGTVVSVNGYGRINLTTNLGLHQIKVQQTDRTSTIEIDGSQVHFNSPLSHQDGFDHTVNGVRIRISGHTVVIA